MRPTDAHGVCGLALASLMGCGGGLGGIIDLACAPASTETCACVGGGSGLRLCQIDGTFADCRCTRPPVADAGGARNVVTGQPATLDGAASSDPDGDPLTFSWTLTSAPEGSSATLANAGAPLVRLTP